MSGCNQLLSEPDQPVRIENAHCIQHRLLFVLFVNKSSILRYDVSAIAFRCLVRPK